MVSFSCEVRATTIAIALTISYLTHADARYSCRTVVTSSPRRNWIPMPTGAMAHPLPALTAWFTFPEPHIEHTQAA